MISDDDIDLAIRAAIVTALPEYGNADRVSTTETDYAIYRAGYAAGIEAAAKVCEEWRRGCDNRSMQAEGWAADECAAAIRAMKEQSK